MEKKKKLGMMYNCDKWFTAMWPGLVLFKAQRICWKKEQKQWFFPWIKNNLITFHSKFVLILDIICKILNEDTIIFRFCCFWRINSPIKSGLVDLILSCLNEVVIIHPFPTFINDFVSIFSLKIQQIFWKRTNFVL